MAIARGSFEVSITPRETSEEEGADALSRMVLGKSYEGDLTGSGCGQMLACMTSVDGSAGYVALELVEARLSGRQGSFVLQHFGIMNRGDPNLRVTIVPDSATGDLSGLSGELDITMVDDTHRYELTYELPE